MLHLYTLLSHQGGCLAHQVRSCREYLPELASVTVVQGPWGDDPSLSAGRVAVRQEVAARESLRLAEAPRDLLGRSVAVRVFWLHQWLLTEIVPTQAEDVAVILSGDVVPTKTLTTDRVLQGRQWAMRGVRTPGDSLTWFWLWRKASCNLKAIPPDDAFLYPARTFRKRDHVEYCEPGWLHLDRIAAGCVGSEKIALLGDSAAEPWTYTVANVPRVRPRHHRPIVPRERTNNHRPLPTGRI